MIVKDKGELLKPCEPIASQTEADEICERLYEEFIQTENGAGLSAPQIGIQKKVCLISGFEEIFFLVNPEIVSYKKDCLVKNEGCLSFPNIFIDTIRYAEIDVLSGIDQKNLHLENFEAIIAQHETDHINGILFFERKAPKKYDLCYCGSGVKFKFCCLNKLWDTRRAK